MADYFIWVCHGSLARMKEHRVKVFVNKVLMSIFVMKRHEIR
jgi:hypothetical protein